MWDGCQPKVGNLLYGRWTVLLIIFLTFTTVSSLRMQVAHDFYRMLVAKWVEQSAQMRMLNKCKMECLQMKNFFPLRFRFHRLIYRQTNGFVKYITGNCEVKLNTTTGGSYVSWVHLKRQIQATNLLGGENRINKGQELVWNAYWDACQDPFLRIGNSKRQNLNLTRVHSNFLYYDDQSFQNLMPFSDLGGMLFFLSSKLPH